MRNSNNFFSFPLKFLWIKASDKKQLLNRISDWSLINYCNSASCEGNQEERFSKAVKDLNLKINCSYSAIIKSYHNMNNMLDSHDIYTSINTSVFFDARDGKLSFELLLFLAAVKSIIGKRNFTKTYKSVIINRMYGDKKKTISRYRFDILMDAAIQRKLINKIPAGRGFYISTRYIDSVEFTKAIIEKIKSYNKAKEERLLNGSLILSFKKEITQNLKNERGKKMNEFQFNYN